MATTHVDVVVAAGGRISGLYARAAGTRVKALVRVGGEPMVTRVVAALRAAVGVERICVVGPECVRDVLGDQAVWQRERGSALENVLAGVEALGAGGADRVLLCGSDVPVMTGPAAQDFLDRAPPEAAFCMPLVRREACVQSFPGDRDLYVRLAEGAFTAGSQYLVGAAALRDNRALLELAFRQRKSQLRMARTLGPSFVWKLVRGQLTVPELEARASELTGAPCRAVPDCAPQLAFDVDNVLDLRYIERWLERARVPG